MSEGTSSPKSGIALLVKNKADRQWLEDRLAGRYRVTVGEAEAVLAGTFDLAVVDGPTLKATRRVVRARRNAEQPVLLPFLLLTVRRKGWPARHLGFLVDDLLIRPVDEDELQARVANLLRLRRLSLELKKEHDRVTRLAVTDDVTGFYNTRYLHRALDRLLASPTARDDQVSLAFFDLDDFKQVVDTHGHPLGAKVLREVAQAVHRVLGEEDRLVRYGGDEYVIILPRQGKQAGLEKVEQMMRAITTTPFLQKEGLNLRLGASFGLAAFPHDAADKRELLAAADRCLFCSKAGGKRRISVAGMQDAAQAA